MIFTDTEKSLFTEIKTVSNLIKRNVDSAVSKNEDFPGITGTHGKALVYLSRHSDKDIFQRDIERDFSIRRSTATKILQCMEKNGLIIRVSVPYDARLKKIVLTEKAEQLDTFVKNRISDMEKQTTENLTEQEICVFFNVIEKIKQNLNKN